MKIIVLSDSHGELSNMRSAIANENPDYIIHLGDHCADAEQLKAEYPLLPITSVRGNCDYRDFSVPEEREAVYDGYRIFSTHGHGFGVKSQLLRLYLAAKEKAAHVVLFGHTHCAYCEYKDGLWMMNPGACGSRGRKSYGIIEIIHDKLSCNIKFIEQE